MHVEIIGIGRIYLLVLVWSIWCWWFSYAKLVRVVLWLVLLWVEWLRWIEWNPSGVHRISHIYLLKCKFQWIKWLAHYISLWFEWSVWIIALVLESVGSLVVLFWLILLLTGTSTFKACLSLIELELHIINVLLWYLLRGHIKRMLSGETLLSSWCILRNHCVHGVLVVVLIVHFIDMLIEQVIWTSICA